jgi:pimeloyl-ACP methyl ester carboxylesterase
VLRSTPVDDFTLAYARHQGPGPPVVLLHGWPGDHADWDAVARALGDELDVVVPDLRGFGESDKHLADPVDAYSAAGQARSVIGLIDELGLERPVMAGYDIGSRIAQEVARVSPASLRALVIAPPLPGVGERVLSASAQEEFWYQAFHQLSLAEQLIDGDRAAVRGYLEHFWTHWSGPQYEPSAHALDRLAAHYGEPGAFVASINWYRAGAGTVARSLAEQAPSPDERIGVPTTVLWPEHDPLFPVQWSDRLAEFFSDLQLRTMPEAGHFSPLEAPERFVQALRERVGCPA